MAEFDLNRFIREDLAAQKGVSIPVHAGILERLFVKRVPISAVHVNEEDLFTHQNVGPSFKVISKYIGKIREAQANHQPVFESLLVEKLHPHGYRLLNGHHRFAAALRVGLKKVPVRIINLASESDIMKILERSEHDKRVTLDLDEVIFRAETDPYLEKPLPPAKQKKYGWRIRLGTPALLYQLARAGYDIWVYTADYYSIDDIRDYFRAYSVNVDGIITGVQKKQENHSESAVRMEKLIANKYKKTLHIDNEMILLTEKGSWEFKEYALDVPEDSWSKKAIELLGEIEKA